MDSEVLVTGISLGILLTLLIEHILLPAADKMSRHFTLRHRH